MDATDAPRPDIGPFGSLKLDLDSPTPLYRQLQHRLREAVERGILKVGDALPGERYLAQSMGVSRVTVRRAIDDLVNDGLLVQRQGAGTFVATRVVQPLSLLTSFSEDMLARGMRPSSVWLEKAIGRATPEEAMALNLPPGAEVVRLARVRIADGTPMALERASVPRRFLPDPEEVTASLYEAMKTRGVHPVRALQRLRAEQILRPDAEHLQVPPGAAVLYIERRAFAADGTPVEFTRSRYRSDLYDFVAELRADIAPPIPEK
ncbi:MAG TPA: GntR family transcriptional regulator [Alphaproteobacteria bacterium]|nr:GntR family transcriptional regulator [Alphaproteobacteria bacterium]